MLKQDKLLLKGLNHMISISEEQKLIRNSKAQQREVLITELFFEYDRMTSSGQETLDKLAKLHNIETEAEVIERLSNMSKEEMIKELEDN